MNLDYSEAGQVRYTMRAYTLKILTEFPEPITRTADSPAANHLFEVRNDSTQKPLPAGRADAFHRTVAQLLFLGTRARRDIRTAVSFLCTRVKSPDEDDWR